MHKYFFARFTTTHWNYLSTTLYKLKILLAIILFHIIESSGAIRLKIIFCFNRGSGFSILVLAMLCFLFRFYNVGHVDWHKRLQHVRPRWGCMNKYMHMHTRCRGAELTEWLILLNTLKDVATQSSLTAPQTASSEMITQLSDNLSYAVTLCFVNLLWKRRQRQTHRGSRQAHDEGGC